MTSGRSRSARPNVEERVAALFAGLARKHGPQGSDMVWRQIDRQAARFAAGELVELAGGRDDEFSLRLARGGELRFASATDAQALAEAARAAAVVPGAPLVVPPGVAPPRAPQDTADPRVRALSAEDLAGLGRQILERLGEEAAARKAPAETAGTTLAVERDVVTTHYFSPQGWARFAATRLGVFLSTGDVGVEWERGRGLPEPEALARRAVEGLLRAAAPPAAAYPDGPVPVVLAGQAVAPLVAALAQAFNGRHVVERVSPMGQWLGQKGFSPLVTLYDDAGAEGARARAFDDEGVPCRRTALIKKGVIAGFYFDRATAAMAKTESTGHGIGGRGRPPEPRPTNLVVEAGDRGLESLLEGLPLAVVVERVMGAVSPGGDFGLAVGSGYLAQKGRPLGPVRGLELQGNLYQALGAVRGLSREREWVEGWLLTPALCLEGLEILVPEADAGGDEGE